MSKDVDASFFNMEQNSTLLSELEEHPDGANCVAWDPTGAKLASCGEDGTVKIYRVINDELNLIATISDHTGGVAACTFHPANNNLISVSEDFSVRMFDSNTCRQLAYFDIPGSRFWCVAAHPRDALIAAGHDQGVVILKTNKERTPFDAQGNSVAWLQDNEVHVVDLITKNQEKPSSIEHGITSLSWNTARSMVLCSYDNEDIPYYKIIDISNKVQPVKQDGISAIWFSRSSFCALDHTREKLLYGEPGSTLSKVSIPHAQRIFPASAQRIYIVTKTSIILFDIARNKQVSEVNFLECKSITLNDDKTKMCARSANSVLTANSELTNTSIFQESSKVKSCCFCGEAVLYTTRTHLRYIVAGNSGVVCSLPRVLYIVKAMGDTAWFVTRDGALFKREIELGEVRLKLALINSKQDGGAAARKIVAEKPPIGFAIMEFSANAGRYDIAESLATDPKVKLNLALKACDFETAVKCADEINTKQAYQTLATACMNSGKITLAEQAYKKAGDTDSLAFLYLITGQQEQLSKVAKQSNNPNHLLWLNDNESIDKILLQSAPSLEEALSNKEEDMTFSTGIQIKTDWPTTRSAFVPLSKADANDSDVGSGWGESSGDENGFGGFGSENGEESGDEGWEIGLNMDGADEAFSKPSSPSGKGFRIPTRGESIPETWSRNATTVGDLVASGQFADALIALKSTINVKNIEPVRELFIEYYSTANGLISTPYGPLSVPFSTQFRSQQFPAQPDVVQLLDDLREQAFNAFSKGKFNDCKNLCQTIIHRAMLASVQTKEEEQKVMDTIKIAMKYDLGVTMELARKSETDPARGIEFAVYFTHVGLLPSHERLALQSAMRVCIKAHNYVTAKPIIQRLLDLAPPEKVANTARQQLAIAMQKQSNAHQIDYNERNPFVVCAVSMKPIYRGKPSIVCPLCGAHAMPQYAGTVCPICGISEFGGNPTGLKILRTLK